MEPMWERGWTPFSAQDEGCDHKFWFGRPAQGVTRPDCAGRALEDTVAILVTPILGRIWQMGAKTSTRPV